MSSQNHALPDGGVAANLLRILKGENSEYATMRDPRVGKNKDTTNRDKGVKDQRGGRFQDGVHLIFSFGFEQMLQLIFKSMSIDSGPDIEEIDREPEETKIWAEEEEFENKKNKVNALLQASGRQRKLGLWKKFLKWKSGKNQLGQEAISEDIVLESNFVTWGPGLEIHQITPGYDLCQISLHLPIGTTRSEIVEMLLEEGLDSSDSRILRIEETGERLEATILTNIRFGNRLLKQKKEPFRHRDIGFEVCRDAAALGTMKPARNTPSVIMTWNSGISSIGAEQRATHALTAVYDNLFKLEGVQMASCCLSSICESTEAKQVTVTVEFDSWDNAILAVRDIQLKRPTTIPSFQVKVSNMCQEFVIPLLQYESQKKQWRQLSDTNTEARQVEIEIIGDEAIVRVQGRSKTLLGALKVRAEKVARGEILDGIYWHPSFESSESASFFGEVMQNANVYLRCRPDTHTLVIYGESGNIEKARKMIQAGVNRREQVMTKTTLTGPSISFFKNGGIHKLKDLVVGEEAVDLKSTSRWSAIMMRGGETATHHLRRLIKESLNKKPVSFQNLPSATTCPVCLDEQLHPEVLGCGHGYCSGCLNRFLDAAAENQTFPIVCVGGGGKCNVPIALPFIRRFLPYHSFKRLIEAAFATYLQRNPTQFQYCRTPDCRQTYRRQSEDKATIMTCPSCFATTCSSCSLEGHTNMTCAEYRIHNTPEQQERLNNELAASKGYKRCPICTVWVEKVGGCDHMVCRCRASWYYSQAPKARLTSYSV